MISSRPAQLTIPLDIPDVDIYNTKITSDGQFIINVESRQETTDCGICGRQFKCNYGHGDEISLRHLPILGRETIIRLRPKRGQCRHCQYEPTTTQVLEWYQPRSPHTKAYDQHLVKQLIGSTIEDVSLKEKVGYDAIVGALKRRLPTEVNWDEISNLGTVGIDEIAMKKGHKGYVAVVTARQDDGEVVILAVLEDRKKKRCGLFRDDTLSTATNNSYLLQRYVGRVYSRH
jgi:transposase